ncbi:hypothetical protein V6N11_001090 [Hibiscus sabdariffa]|uniref:GAG-pre-integrase domain-containing protein n=1 Tax=Hibiscus sabdariffa TaxID=183260 RepID=A0ABR2RYQ8_9ROSI
MRNGNLSINKCATLFDNLLKKNVYNHFDQETHARTLWEKLESFEVGHFDQDTGASIHVTLRRDFFTSYTPGDFGVLKMGNDGLVSVTSMRDVSLVSNNGTKLILEDVRHAPNIRLNLISAGRLDDEGFCNTFSDSSIELWHKRLSHMSEKWLNCLAKKNQLSGLKNATLKNCAHDLARKQRRVSFRSHPPHRKSESLELIHLDVCGLIKTIDDIDKTGKKDSLDNGDLTDVNLVPLDPSLNPSLRVPLCG